MEMIAKEGFFDLTQTVQLAGKDIHFRTALPQKMKTWMALDMAEAGLVFDYDLGIAYESYTREVVLVVCMMRYYTDLDLSAYQGQEGYFELYDILESHGMLDYLYGQLAPDLEKVKAIYNNLYASAAKTFVQRHSLDYLVRKSFGSLLSTEDITQTIAEASDVNNTMVDLLGAFAKLQTPQKMVDEGLTKFGKRDTGPM